MSLEPTQPHCRNDYKPPPDSDLSELAGSVETTRYQLELAEVLKSLDIDPNHFFNYYTKDADGWTARTIANALNSQNPKVRAAGETLVAYLQERADMNRRNLKQDTNTVDQALENLGTSRVDLKQGEKLIASVPLMTNVAQALKGDDDSMLLAAELVVQAALSREFQSTRGNSKYLKLLDSGYGQQLWLKILNFDYETDPKEAGGIQLQTLLGTALEERTQYFEFLTALRNIPVISLFGSANDELVFSDSNIFSGPMHLRFAKEIAQELVSKGVSLISGYGPGFMGLFGEIFAKEIVRQERQDEVFVFGLPLLLSGETIERQVDIPVAIVGPAIGHFISRTGGLIWGGLDLAELVLPGGVGTNQEVSETVLSKQLGGSVLTAHTEKPSSPIYHVNTLGYYRGHRIQMDRQVSDKGMKEQLRKQIHYSNPLLLCAAKEFLSLCDASLKEVSTGEQDPKKERELVATYAKKYHAQVPWTLEFPGYEESITNQTSNIRRSWFAN